MRNWLILVALLAALAAGYILGGNSRNPADCPTTTTQARTMFTGNVNQWTRDGNTWVNEEVTTRPRTVTVPPWYARSVADADGVTFFGAQVEEARVTLQVGQVLTVYCPSG
jgi:hypothetical protein